jgi:hypothetical protein
MICDEMKWKIEWAWWRFNSRRKLGINTDKSGLWNKRQLKKEDERGTKWQWITGSKPGPVIGRESVQVAEMVRYEKK